MPIRRSLAPAAPAISAASRSPGAPRVLLVAAIASAVAAAAITAGARRWGLGGDDVVRSQEHRFRVVTVASGLDYPWGIAFLPDGDLLVTERAGRLRRVHGDSVVAAPVAGVPAVAARGQGGLLDVALHPRFAENRLVYLTYSKPGPDGATTALARGRLEGNALVGVQDLFVADAWRRTGQHFGSRIVFDDSGHVYVGVGEGNLKAPAQDLGSHLGKIVRLHDDGRVPADNPFVARAGAKPEIFSYGHRNPQGMTLHPTTRALWASEHGARGGDEINHVRAGRNYGWPSITHGVDYSGARISPDTALPGMEQPVLHWTPSIAPSGLAIYAGDRFPRWRGNALGGALAGEQLRRVVLDGDRVVRQETMLKGRWRIREVKVGPDGLVYLLTDEARGKVLRLEPVAE